MEHLRQRFDRGILCASCGGFSSSAKAMNDPATSLHDFDEQLREQLERFVVENRDLDDLEHQLCTFNIFSTLLRVERLELQHSNVLAYFLNPINQHGLGDRFLK